MHAHMREETMGQLPLGCVRRGASALALRSRQIMATYCLGRGFIHAYAYELTHSDMYSLRLSYGD